MPITHRSIGTNRYVSCTISVTTSSYRYSSR